MCSVQLTGALEPVLERALEAPCTKLQERGPHDWRALSLASGIAAVGKERQKQKPK